MNIVEIKNKLKKIMDSDYESLAVWEKIIKLSNIDDNGNGDILNIDDLRLIKNLNIAGNGNVLRNSNPIHKYFIVLFNKKSNRTISIKINGFQVENFEQINNSIPANIRKKLIKQKCSLCEVTHEQQEIDHKIGYKIKYNEKIILDDDLQYQMLCKNVNDAKRHHCKICCQNKKRFDARILNYKLPFVSGSFEFVENAKNPCFGCFWYDPREFRQKSGEIMYNLGKRNFDLLELDSKIESNINIEDIIK